MSGGAEAVQAILNQLFDRDDVLGVVAASREGLVLAVAGMPAEQAALVAALGAPLASVSERALERLGGNQPELLTIDSADGMIHVRGGRDLVLIALTERCETLPLGSMLASVTQQISEVFSLV